MKTVKRIFALALAMMLVFSLALTANATDLTVDGALKGATYNMYKMASVEVQASGAYVYTAEADWVEFLKDLSWINFFDDEEPMKFVSEGTPAEAVMVAAAKAAKAYVASKSIGATKTATATSGENPAASFTDVADGYYLMTSDKGSLCTMTTITDDVDEITEKNKALPKIEKTVDDAEVAIGDTVTFTLAVIAGENHGNEMNYVIHDKMTTGLALVEGSVKILLKNAEFKGYTIDTTCEDDCSFEIVFDNTLNTAANDTITVTYDATVTKDIGVTATNTAKIADSTSNDVTVTTTDFTLEKVDGNDQALTGAKFKLYVGTVDDEGETATTTYTEVPVVKTEDAYRPAVTGETAVEIEAGTATVKGLDPDKAYYVKEIEAPKDYVLKDEHIPVTLGDTVTVENVKGENLPSTGGMGTTMFYTVGGLMVAAAVVLLAAKKRMSAV